MTSKFTRSPGRRLDEARVRKRGEWPMSFLAGWLRPLLSALPALLVGAAAAAPLPQYSIDSFVLGNGMQVVVIPDRRAPIVTHMVWYKAGSADEPPGKSGIA